MYVGALLRECGWIAVNRSSAMMGDGHHPLVEPEQM